MHTSLSSHHAAIQTLRNERDAKIAALQAEIRSVRDAYDDAETFQNAALQDARAELECVLTADVKATLWPLWASFVSGENQRATAVQIAQAWRDLTARAHDELGEDLDYRINAMACADALTPDGSARLASPVDWIFGGEANDVATKATHAASFYCEGWGAPCEHNSSLDLEVEVSKRLRSGSPHPERRDAMLSACTTASIARALVAFDSPAPEPRPEPEPAKTEQAPIAASVLSTDDPRYVAGFARGLYNLVAQTAVSS